MTIPAPAPYQQPQQAGHYVSPIPVTDAHLGHAVASEWTKIRSVRSTMWTLGVMFVLVFGIGLLAAVAVRSSSAPMNNTPVLSMGFFGVLLGSMCVITLGVLTVASEYGTGMIRTTLTACPSRGRVLTAKGIVFFLLSFVILLVTTTLVAVIQYALLNGTSNSAPSGGDWFRATVGVSLYVALLGLLALAVGSLIRHSAGAITVMLGLLLLPLVLALFMFSDSLATLREKLFEYSIPNQLSAFYDTSVANSGPSGWEPLWILLGVTAVVYGAALAVLNQRDV
ncbi:ABC transporter permease subunit [Streptomyces sp. NBC_01387]|uniref:ABC transporter permease subunit n=1 Tax=unclassified Streptomyces TaxID=2593676 RepID=UPI0020256238|nr:MULTISPECIES: ABC transporter permease subunit [unclassified Streptomyces]MCX4548141.1 ABC transporter permease subunit [Streptomyces sp. NBC_01500]WSC19798.1 ABC transporter permease subunit [Streptomyces sp. NBC_01766]WSV53822.1 ABC transporter permease subunit [Streptomyces sp. NBC_01014]